jgi:hypothetical protein
MPHCCRSDFLAFSIRAAEPSPLLRQQNSTVTSCDRCQSAVSMSGAYLSEWIGAVLVDVVAPHEIKQQTDHGLGDRVLGTYL